MELTATYKMTSAAARPWSALRQGIGPGLSGVQDLVVITYNILADKFAMGSMHSQTPPEHLTWEFRAPRILQEIAGYAADIVCLQEVELPFMEDTLRPQLQTLGYQVMPP